MAKKCIARQKKNRNRVVANQSFLRLLHSSNAKQRKQLCKIANKDQILSVCECAFNILKKNIPITKAQEDQLRRHKRFVYKLVDKSVPLIQKKKVLEQSGGFVQFLLAPVLGAILGEVAGEIFKK
jgi:hypothetical protein